MTYENKKTTGRLLVLFFTLLFILFAFRSYNVGRDTLSYIEEFILGFSFDRGFDLGFAAFLSLMRSAGFSSRAFLAVMSFITLTPIFMYIKAWSTSNRVFIVLLYMTIGNMTFNLSGMRQSVAIAFLLMGLYFVTKTQKKIIQLIILSLFIFLAYTMHNSAEMCILVIPLFLLAKSDVLFKKKLLVCCLVLPLLGLFLSQYFAVLVNYFMVSKYENYDAEFGDSNFIAYFVIPYTMFAFATWLMLNAKCIEYVDKFGYLCALVYAIAASASIYMPILARLEYYFSLPFICLIGNMTARLPHDSRRLLMVIISLICIAFFLISTPGGTLAIDNYEFSVK